MATTRLVELRDQSLHAVYAVCLMAGFVFPVPPVLALLMTMVVAVLRELDQHEWDFGRIGKLDLSFWFMACCLFILVHHILRGY